MAKHPRRDVSSEEIVIAYWGDPNDEESIRKAKVNRKIISSVCNRFRKYLDNNDEGYHLFIVWRTLQHHQEELGQKFTSSLYQFAVWECLKEKRKYLRRNRLRCFSLDASSINVPTYVFEPNDDLSYVQMYMNRLPFEWMRDVLHQYYFEGLGVREIGRRNGYSAETARRKLKQSVDTLRKICCGVINEGEE